MTGASLTGSDFASLYVKKAIVSAAKAMISIAASYSILSIVFSFIKENLGDEESGNSISAVRLKGLWSGVSFFSPTRQISLVHFVKNLAIVTLSRNFDGSIHNQMTSTQKFSVERKRAAAAYTSWAKERSLASRTSSSDTPKEFIRAIRAQLPYVNASQQPAINLPASKQGWSDWRNKSFVRAALLSGAVCETILAITGFDITEDQCLPDFTINITDVAVLDQFLVKRISNKPTGGQNEYELSLTQIDFKQSDTLEVTADWVSRPASSHDHQRVVGTIKWGIREAKIDIEAPGNLAPVLETISAGETTDIGVVSTAIASILEDSLACGRWLIQSIPGQVLSGRCKGLVLAKNRCQPESEIILTVSARAVDVVPDFIPLTRGPLKNDSVQRVKEQLISRMLSIKLSNDVKDDIRVLCRSRITAP